MSEMIERVAKAIWEAKGSSQDVEAAFHEMARAAIAAMREPTKHMLAKGETAVDNNIDSTSDTEGSYDIINRMGAAAGSWRAMIDAALAESSRGVD